jgi:hypothetical protein
VFDLEATATSIPVIVIREKDASMITRVAFDMRLSDATMSRLAAPSRKLPQGLAGRPLNIPIAQR